MEEMKKLTIEHLAPYLPYGLKFSSIGGKFAYMGVNGCYKDNLSSFGNGNIGRDISFQSLIRDFKPILRPLSDLTKEIEYNGTFTPKDELFHIWCEYCNADSMKSDNQLSFDVAYWIPREPLKIKWWPKWMTDKLFEWHFDIFNLIPDGLAIDINTLPTNS